MVPRANNLLVFKSKQTMFLKKKNSSKKQKNKRRQYNIQIFDKIIFIKYRTLKIKATETNKIISLTMVVSV